jgi:hypothetical protein
VAINVHRHERLANTGFEQDRRRHA